MNVDASLEVEVKGSARSSYSEPQIRKQLAKLEKDMTPSGIEQKRFLNDLLKRIKTEQ